MLNGVRNWAGGEVVVEIESVLDGLQKLAVSVLSGGVGGGLLFWLLRDWISERLRQSIRHEYNQSLAEYTTKLKAESEKQLERYRYEIRQAEAVDQERWRIKRDACIRALDIANAVLSNRDYENVPKGTIVKQEVTTAETRACLDELACTCDRPDVMSELKRIVIGESVRPDAIVDLRAAIRRELGFGDEPIDTDRETAFVARIAGDPAAGGEP